MEASVGTGTPFYMQLSHYAPHLDFHALAETIEQWQGIEARRDTYDPVYAAMTENLDTGIGRVLDKLQDLGVEDDTYVIYTSDHGQTANLSTNFPLTRGKGTLWEGGHARAVHRQRPRHHARNVFGFSYLSWWICSRPLRSSPERPNRRPTIWKAGASYRCFTAGAMVTCAGPGGTRVSLCAAERKS